MLHPCRCLAKDIYKVSKSWAGASNWVEAERKQVEYTSAWLVFSQEDVGVAAVLLPSRWTTVSSNFLCKSFREGIMPVAFQISPYTPELRTKFAEIWVPWLKSLTGKDPEPEDLLAVGDPESFYVSKGGAVFFALIDGNPLGVVAVKNLSDGVYEFCKLVVLEQARGLGVGKNLVQACIDFSTSQGARVLMLQSFKRLEIALGMYERMGFVVMTPPPQMNVLARTELVMGMPLIASRNT